MATTARCSSPGQPLRTGAIFKPRALRALRWAYPLASEVISAVEQTRKALGNATGLAASYAVSRLRGLRQAPR